MMQISDNWNCCGCSACVQRCPKQCISLFEDGEGFLYPQVNIEECIDCGVCERVCPFLNQQEKKEPLKVLAVKNRNEEERLNSSSGGVFIALAKEVLDRGGVVFGAVYDEKWEVKHTWTDTFQGVKPMMGSKYLQSRIENTYKEAEEFLKQDKKVLFVGSPCQISGLKRFLRKDYGNLLAVDFLCHGVPSPGVWRRYIEELRQQSARRAAAGKNTVLSSLNELPVITGIAFRDKMLYGWKKYSFVVRGGSAFKADQNSVLLSDIHYENTYMKGFLSDVYLRPSCYVCKCKNGRSQSDLTIADFWGIDRVMPEFDDDKGVGLVLVNSQKGYSFFNRLDMEIRESNRVAAQYMNGGFKETLLIHPKRRYFFKMLASEIPLSVIINRSLEIPFHAKISMYIKYVLKKILPNMVLNVIKRK